jgi:6-phosphogluconolactonase
LFPGHPALSETSRRVLAITDSPKPPPRRLTLTLPALAGAEIFIAAFGAAKAEVMREALHAPASPLPVARAARLGRSAVFLLDDEVGKLLQSPFIG